MKPTIVFDLDDTIGNLREPLAKALNKYCKTNLCWTKWDSFNIVNHYDIDIQEFFDVIINEDILSKMEPHKDAVNVINKLSKDNEIVVITSRNYHPDALNVTTKWFENVGIHVDKIHISGHGLKKSTFANLHDNVIMTVDDYIGNCIDFQDNLKTNVLLMDMPWNVNSDFKRIYSLSDIHNMYA